jgi:hypothetical protein
MQHHQMARVGVCLPVLRGRHVTPQGDAAVHLRLNQLDGNDEPKISEVTFGEAVCRGEDRLRALGYDDAVTDGPEAISKVPPVQVVAVERQDALACANLQGTSNAAIPVSSRLMH